jgi:acylglycerol lipase
MVRKGIAVVYIEIEGHGRSDGPMCLIEDWDVMTNDVAEFFQQVKKTRFQGKPFFLMGESMGGAICYTVYNKMPDVFKGVVFQSPMCRISEDMLPPKFVVDILHKLLDPRSITRGLGYLPIAPAEDKLQEYLGTNKESLAMVDRCPTLFSRNPRLTTAKTLLDVTTEISKTLSAFDAPFFIQHGSADKITDPKLSQALYDESKSKDKEIKLYEGTF